MKTSLIFALLAALAAGTGAQEAGRQPPAESRQITQAYDKAFENYLAGKYQEAIDQWNKVLRLDPSQVTAKNMILEARQKLAGSASGQKGKFYALVARGRYGDALIKIEEMAALDPSNPAFPPLAARLKKVNAVIDRKPVNSRPWNLCVMALYHFLNEEENLPFAYDALRYSAELAPDEPRFGRLVAALEEESPQLKLNDTKPPQVGILDHKKELALHYIYDSKFYLAVKELESVLKLEPEDTVALKRLGSTYLQLKDYKRARATWEKAMQLAPGDEQLQEYIKALDAIPGAAAKAGKSRPVSRRAKRTKRKPAAAKAPVQNE